MKRFSLPPHKEPNPKGKQRPEGLIRLLKSVHTKYKKPGRFFAELKRRFPFVPNEVIEEIRKEHVSAMQRIDRQLRDPSHDKISVKDLSIIRVGLMKEQLRNIAITILRHERRRNN